MKVTVDIPDSDLEEVCFFTGERKKGPALLKLINDALMLKRREKLSRKFISGEWGVKLDGFEAGRSGDVQAAKSQAKKWRNG
ncbi:MAG: hypothetical protein ACREH8_08620 [Opitutaceae bacterium]